MKPNFDVSTAARTLQALRSRTEPQIRRARYSQSELNSVNQTMHFLQISVFNSTHPKENMDGVRFAQTGVVLTGRSKTDGPPVGDACE